MKIVTILGARPQFIKSAPVGRAFAKNNIEEVIIHTGQHFDENMSKVFFDEMGIKPPKYNLNINNLSHGAMTGKMLEQIEEILIKEQPDWVLVYGDTNSTLAGSLAAKKLNIRLAHIEAGLRTHDMNIPEEMNRVITDRISDVLFCPTHNAENLLIAENFHKFPCDVLRVGDVMYDAVIQYKEMQKKPKIDLPEKFILSTFHRAENTDDADKLHAIISALEKISQKYFPVVLPLHPRTKHKLQQLNYDINSSVIQFIEPASYLEMLYLIEHSELIIADSGGLQKDAYFLNKFSVFVYDTITPWVELMEKGYLKSVKPIENEIIKATDYYLSSAVDFVKKDLYGTGRASEEIVNYFLSK